MQDDPESVECRNGVCQCKFKYSPDTEQNRCVRPREKSKKSVKWLFFSETIKFLSIFFFF